MNYILLLLLPFVLIACAPLAPEVDLSQTSAVIYHEDTRQEVEKTSSVSSLAQATVTLVEGRLISQNADTTWSLGTRPLEKSYPLCADEKFLKQPVLGFCSGVLVAPDKILTAGHCVAEKDICKNTKFIFGWDLERSQHKTLANSEVFHCKNILRQENNRSKGIDYAIIELDRPAKGIQPVSIAKDALHKRGDLVLSLSYPMGLPLKQDIGKVLESADGSYTLKVEVDTFMGSSGSPLFNGKGELLGILSSGMEDFLEDDIYRVQSEGGCINFHRCKNGTCFGERFFKTSNIDL
ncbi:MAG: serine protease [Bdellovibrio sp.]|nr:serine protease [Bdellovibrio sp.]